MELEINERRTARRKRAVRLAAGLFAALLILCTLFSNTMMSLTLTRVGVVTAQAGALDLSYNGSADLAPVEVINLTGPTGWKVQEALVQEGDRVKKGQALVRYDGTEAKQQLEDAKAALQKLELSMEKMQLDYIEAEHSADAAAVMTAKVTLESAKIDQNSQSRHVELMEKQLQENQELTAPFDGIIQEVHAQAGLPGSGSPDIRISNEGKGLQFELRLPAGMARKLKVGDPIDAVLEKDISKQIAGKISRLEEETASSADSTGLDGKPVDSPTAKVVVSVIDPEVKGGERVNVRLSIPGASGTLLLPSSAIRKDSSGAYVYVLEEQMGPLGNAYYAARRSVAVSESNDAMAAVTSGLFNQDRIIVEASGPVMDGDRVRL